MRKIALKLFTCLAILSAGSAAAQSIKSKRSSPASKPSIIFFDDFSGKNLDRSKWNVEVTGKNIPNNEQQTYVDSSATIYISRGAEAAGAQNGVLVINPVFKPGYQNTEGRKADFLSGRINSKSKVEFTYGRVSARMKLPKGTGFWPAFWALGDGNWPDCGEIDIMENVGEADWISAALHGPGYFGETPIVNKVFLKKDITQWHVYSVDWTKNALLFKVDGEMYYRVTRTMVENYGKWAFDTPKFLIVNLALGGAYPYKTNGFKTPYNGIPDATFTKIKNGQGKVLVDWVKVVK